MTGTDGRVTEQYDEEYKNPEVLHRLYHEEGMIARDIGKKLGIGRGGVLYWMRKHDIPRRKGGGRGEVTPGRPWADADRMERLYVEEGLTSEQIAEKFDCSPTTVIVWLGNHGIERRRAGVQESPYIAPLSTHKRGHVRWRHKEHTVEVHRLLGVAEFGFEAVGDMHVHHVNEIPWDNRPGNLELLSNSDHQKVHRKLNWLDRIRIAEMYHNTDVTTRQLGEVFDVSSATIVRHYHNIIDDTN